MTFSSIYELKRMALRNLARHKVKTILSVLAVTISVTVYIVMDGWIEGMTIDSLRNLVNYETGAAKLQTKAYFEKLDDKPMYENFTDWERYAAALDKEGYVSTPRFVFAGTLYSDSGSAPVEFNGIEPETDGALMHLSGTVEFGRFIKEDEFAILLGSVTAEKLKTGIPTRPTKFELENDILPTLPEAEQSFVRSLYTQAEVKKPGAFAKKETELAEGDARFILRKDLGAAELDKYWKLLAETGRMNLQIAAVIDIKAPPDSLRREKYDLDLKPLLTDAERGLFEKAYSFDDVLDAWMINTDDEALLDSVLAAMVRADYSGAIRHVNQLLSVELAGTVNSPDPKLNYNTAFIPLGALQGDSGMMLSGEATELIIRKKGAPDSALPGADESAEAVTAAIEAGIAGTLPDTLAVHDWKAYGKDALAAAAGDNWSTRIMVIILFILSFLGIANTMLLAILERTREIGMIRAQGMTDGELLFTLMMEAGLVGLIGAAAGVLIGCLITIPMVNPGVNFAEMTDAMGGDIGYRISGVFRSAWNPPVIILSGIAASVLSALVAFFPARRALTMSITDSLRFE
ncbi:MAG: FtsX-like permease family protein [Spirochaetaceae bacterium]|jgi:ABC-type lipoprotein release transport system permease subunit|nr:FtsX-like permease family protein [Spirochaetaceae bacterium]